MTAPRRAQNRARRTERILRAALDVFSEQGYTGATMDAIAARAGLSKPTLYSYFDGKAQIFSAMFSAPREDMLLAFEVDRDARMVAQLHRFAWTYARIVMRPEYLSLARLIIGEAQRFPEIGEAYQASGPDRVLQGMMAYLEAHRAAGDLTFEDAELAAQDLWGLILSAPRTQALHRPDAIPDERALARYVTNGLRVFLKAYATDPVAALADLAEVTQGTA